MKNIKMGYSPLTETIFAGTINKKGDMWLKKEDVTRDFIACIIEFVGINDTRTIKVDGKDKFIVSIKEIKEA